MMTRGAEGCKASTTGRRSRSNTPARAGQASVRGERSYSLRAARAFLEAYRACHPDDRVETLEPTSEIIPAFDRTAVRAKYRVLHGDRPTKEQMGAWRRIERQIERFKAAAKLLLSAPMWNFGVPHRLKPCFDVLVQPGCPFAAEAALAQAVEEAPRLAEIF